MKRKVVLGVIRVLFGLLGMWYAVVSHIWGYIEYQSEDAYQNVQTIDNDISSIVEKGEYNLQEIGDEIDYNNPIKEDVFLLDTKTNTLISRCQGKLYIGAIGEEDEYQKGIVDVLLKHSNEQERKVITYERTDTDSNRTKREFVYCLPVESTTNGVFTIGISVAFDNTIKRIQQMAFFVLLSVLLLVLGISFFVNVTIKTWKTGKKRKQEIQQLYEKNAEIERQNQEMQEMAHRQRLETIGMLTSGIAHEFNNLLTPIMGYSMMLLEQIPEENEETCDNVIEIYNASRKAKDIISRLSDLSRKRDAITYTDISIDKTIDKTLNVIKSVQPKSVSVETKLECEGQMISGNETLLMQMVLNLVLNAFQAMEQDGGVVMISTVVENEQIILSVKDTGPGIKEEDQRKIFEPFFTTKQSMKGTGLGLAIVQQVVEAHHGKINVISKIGEGCTFVVSFPLDEKTIAQ